MKESMRSFKINNKNIKTAGKKVATKNDMEAARRPYRNVTRFKIIKDSFKFFEGIKKNIKFTLFKNLFVFVNDAIVKRMFENIDTYEKHIFLPPLKILEKVLMFLKLILPSCRSLKAQLNDWSLRSRGTDFFWNSFVIKISLQEVLNCF